MIFYSSFNNFMAFAVFLIPVLMFFLITSIIIFGQRRYPKEEEDGGTMGQQFPKQDSPLPRPDMSKKNDDIDAMIAKMEEHLRQMKKPTAKPSELGGGRIYRPTDQKIHTETCAVPHSRNQVYREATTWGDEGAGLERASVKLSVSTPAKRRLRLQHPDLVNGFIFSEILAKPRSLRPYDEAQS